MTEKYTQIDVEQVKPCNEDDVECTGDPSTCKKDPSECSGTLRSQAGSQAQANADDCLGKSLDQLSKAFTASARRWELIVYPSLVAFIVLAAYGFFLIYSLTKDVSIVASQMQKITTNMDKVSSSMYVVSQNMVLITKTVDKQSVYMQDMASSMRYMNTSMNQMRYDISVMNNSVSRPMQFMNSFMPW